MDLKQHLESLLRTLEESTAANRADMDRKIAYGFDHRYAQGRADAFDQAAEWLRDTLGGGEAAGRSGDTADAGLDLTPAGQSAFRRAAAAYAQEGR
jgi:hypothetical protein